MTRQRTRESLERHLCEPCFYCDGKGSIKSKRTVAYDIFRAISLKASHFSEPHIVVQTHPEIADLLQGEELGMLQEIGKLAGKEITVTPRGSFHQQQFDVYGTTKG